MKFHTKLRKLSRWSKRCGAGLTSFNTVKVPATGVEDDGKIRITVYGINRIRQGGVQTELYLELPLNKVRVSLTLLQKSYWKNATHKIYLTLLAVNKQIRLLSSGNTLKAVMEI